MTSFGVRNYLKQLIVGQKRRSNVSFSCTRHRTDKVIAYFRKLFVE